MSNQVNELCEDIECPICGKEATLHQTLEPPQETINCHVCGYVRRFVVTNLRESNKPSDFEWTPRYEIIEELGFGGYRLTLNHSAITECGSFTNSGSAAYFESEVKRLGSEVTHASYSELIDGQIQYTVLVDKLDPQSQLY